MPIGVRAYQCVIFFLMLSNCTIVFMHLTGEHKKSEMIHVSKKNRDLEKGFHPIFAYYGPESAIQSFQEILASNSRKVGSQVNQDKIVMNITSEIRSRATNVENWKRPYFVDLAANDAVIYSNTFRLETEGWSGLCIEPNPRYWYRLSHRQCDVAGAFVGGSFDAIPVNVTLANKEFGGIIGRHMDNKPTTKKLHSELRYTVSLSTLFRKFNVPKTINFLSLDVEGAEELIMKDFPFDEYKFGILTVERPNQALQITLKANWYTCVAVLSEFGESMWVHTGVLEVFDLASIQSIIASINDGHKPCLT